MPEEVALRDWDRAITTEGDIAAFVSAWNETPWEQLPGRCVLAWRQRRRR